MVNLNIWALSASIVTVIAPWTILAQVATDVGVDYINIPKYTGNWFELLTTKSIQNTIESGCQCSQAYYDLADDPHAFSIYNGCIRNSQWSNVTGYAIQSNPVVYPGKFNVTINAIESDYNVLKLWRDDNGNYEYVLVGGRDVNSFWLLGRSPMYPPQQVINRALHQAACDGYNVTDVVLENNKLCPTLPRQ